MLVGFLSTIPKKNGGGEGEWPFLPTPGYATVPPYTRENNTHPNLRPYQI